MAHSALKRSSEVYITGDLKPCFSDSASVIPRLTEPIVWTYRKESGKLEPEHRKARMDLEGC